MTSPLGHYPRVRPRRNRRGPAIRALVQENRLTASDLILPVFVHDGDGPDEPIGSLPGVVRHNLDSLVERAHEAWEPSTARSREGVHVGCPLVEGVARETTVLQGGSADLLWRAGDRPGDGLRNGRGEQWLRIDGITADGPDLIVDIGLCAISLLGAYHRASWTGHGPGLRPVPIIPDRFDGPAGHVMLEDGPQDGGGQALFMHPRWVHRGEIVGRYPIAAPMRDRPGILYATVGMADDAIGSDGAVVRVSTGGQTVKVRLMPGDERHLVADFAVVGETLDVAVDADGSASRDRVYLRDAWFVPDAPRIHDLVAIAAEAEWRSGLGVLAFDGPATAEGEAGQSSRLRLDSGELFFGRALCLHPARDSVLDGVFTGLTVPPGGAVLRGRFTRETGRHDPMASAELELSWRPAGQTPWHAWLAPTPFEAGYRSGIELALTAPDEARGQGIELRLRVRSVGSMRMCWTKLALTAL